MRIVLTYLLLLSWSYVLAQSQPAPCIYKDSKAPTELNICEKIQCFYQHKDYISAFKVFKNFDGEVPCIDQAQVVTIARTLAANNKFEDAVKFLNGKMESGISKEKLKTEKERIEQLKYLAEKESGAYMRNKVMLNTSYNDIIAFEFHDSLIQLNDKSFNISYFPHVETVKGQFHFPLDSTGKAFFSPIKFNWENFSNFGTGGCFHDSLIFLSVVENTPYTGADMGGNFEIICMDAQSKKEIKKYELSVKKGSAAHPAIADSILIFSSDMAGGSGGMDLYKAKMTKKGFENIQNLGAEVNSTGNEVFPTVIGDTLYFSSDRDDMGFGALDIYKVALQGGAPRNVGVPINTAYDDFGALSDGKSVKYMISNRPGGSGGSDIYALNWAPTRLFFKQLKGRFNATGADLSNIVVEIKSSDGSIAQTTTLDKDGYFVLPHVKGMETYDISIVEGEMPDGSRLSLFGDEGNVIKEVAMDKKGGFRFELLSPQDYFLEHMVNTDESVLSVDILGMLDSESDSQEGFKIYLEDSEGEVVGMAVTDSAGNFAFKSVKPDAEYVIKSQITDPDAAIRILDKDGKTITTIKPKGGNEYAYVRLSDTDKVITLTNESEQKVKIAENELFNLPVLYFGLDEAELTKPSKKSLDKLVVLLKKNPEVSLELSGHTDSRGSAAYNLKLSQNRIDAVVDYLVAAGISKNHLVGKGYGETRLLNGCKDGVPCTEKQHAVNRRTELRIFQSKNP